MTRAWRLALVLGMLASGGCAAIREHRFVSRVKNKPAADFQLTALDGEAVRLSDYRGRPVIVAFWAYG